MRRLVLPFAFAAILLAGACAPKTAPLPEPVTPPDGAADQCGAGQLAAYVGSAASDANLAKVRTVAGHDRIRVIRPGMAVTMDYRADRLNIDIGEDGRIRRFYCS